MTNITLTEFTSELVKITGIGSVVAMTDILITNIDLFSKPAVYFKDYYRQVTIFDVNVDNVTTDTDGSIINIQQATILQASQLSFTNIHSYSSDSTNNYMMEIVSMDLSATYPSTLQNISVSDFTTGVLKIQTLTGNLSDNNMLLIQDFTISDSNLTNSIDLITLKSLMTHESYSIVFSNMVFQNLNFLQGANLLNFEHLTSNPVELKDSKFFDIEGGKINVQSFTSNLANLSTSLTMTNITVDYINSQFDSFITLQTGAIVSISDSSFTNTNCYEEGSVLFAGTEYTQTTIENTIFENNTALLGAVMFIEQQSVVICVNCTFFNNFAVEGGVVAAFDNGYFIFNESMFDNNIAISGLVAYVFSSVSESSIVASNITKNRFVSSSFIMNEITGTCSIL